MNLDEVRDEPVEYGKKAHKRKRRENLENDPPTAGIIAKNLFGGGAAVLTAKDAFSENQSALFTNLAEDAEDDLRGSERQALGERQVQ